MNFARVGETFDNVNAVGIAFTFIGCGVGVCRVVFVGGGWNERERCALKSEVTVRKCGVEERAWPLVFFGGCAKKKRVRNIKGKGERKDQNGKREGVNVSSVCCSLRFVSIRRAGANRENPLHKKTDLKNLGGEIGVMRDKKHEASTYNSHRL